MSDGRFFISRLIHVFSDHQEGGQLCPIPNGAVIIDENLVSVLFKRFAVFLFGDVDDELRWGVIKLLLPFVFAAHHDVSLWQPDFLREAGRCARVVELGKFLLADVGTDDETNDYWEDSIVLHNKIG